MARYRAGFGPVTLRIKQALGIGEWVPQREILEAAYGDRAVSDEKDALWRAIRHMNERRGYQIEVSTCYRLVKKP